MSSKCPYQMLAAFNKKNVKLPAENQLLSQYKNHHQHMKNIFLFTAIVLNTGVVNAQSPISDYLSVPFPNNLVGSKNGKTIAWVFNDKGSRNIYMADAAGNNVNRITNYSGDDGMDLGDIQLSSNGEQIIFVRGNPPNNKGETANPALLQTSTERVIYSINNTGGELKKINTGTGPQISPDGKLLAFISGGQIWLASLTDTTAKPQKLFQSRGNQSGIQWSPDAQAIAFVSNRVDHSFIGLYQMTSKAVQFIETSVDLDGYPAWSPDGKQIAYIRIPNIHNELPFTPIRESNPWSIRVYDIESGNINEIWKASTGRGSVLFTELPVGNKLLWWGAGQQLVFSYEKDGWVHLYALDKGSKIPRLLTPGNGEVENVNLSANRQTIYYTTNIGDIDRRHIWQVSVASGKSKQITTGKENEWWPVETDNGFAFLHSSATRPAWPAVWHNNVQGNVATGLYPKNFPANLVEPTAITITASDGFKSNAQLFLPANYDAAKKYPAIIFLHGGSRRQMLLGFHYSQYYSNAYAFNQYFAQNGYIVVALNYRSGIGYGLDYREALNYGAAGASEVKDLLAAGVYLQKRNDVAANKIALWGGSYGGYLTAHGLSQAPTVFATGVDIHGVHNWNDEIPTFAPWYDYAKFPEMAKLALLSSPVIHIKNWKAPVLLIHGDDDRNVPFSESVNFAELLRKQQVTVEQLILPDEVHFFLLHKNWVKVYEASFEFINRQLKIK